MSSWIKGTLWVWFGRDPARPLRPWKRATPDNNQPGGEDR